MSQPWVPVYAQIDIKFAVITITTVEVTIGEGNLTYSEQRTIEYTLDRGLLDEVREGDEVPVDVSFDFTWTEMSGGTIKDAIVGNTGFTSSDADTCRPYACDIVVTYTPSPSGCGSATVITLPDFRWESIDHDLRAGTFSISGKCNAKEPTVTREAQ